MSTPLFVVRTFESRLAQGPIYLWTPFTLEFHGPSDLIVAQVSRRKPASQSEPPIRNLSFDDLCVRCILRRDSKADVVESIRREFRLGAGLGATKEVRMTPNFRQATPEAALRFLTATAVNRQAVGSNPTRGANSLQINNGLVLQPALFRTPLVGNLK